MDEPSGRRVKLGADALTPAVVAEIARLRGGRVIEFDDTAAGRVASAEGTLRDSQAADAGVPAAEPSGDRIATVDRDLVACRLAGSGLYTAPEVVRATMLVHANCLARGYSGVSVRVVRLLTDMLRHDILPLIPERGSVAADGDLVPLCYLASAMSGDGEVMFRGEVVPAATAMEACGLEAVGLRGAETPDIGNGTSFMSGFAVLASVDAAELARVADICTALASEVFRQDHSCFDYFPHSQKPHPGQLSSALRIRDLLQGSTNTYDGVLLESHTVLNAGGSPLPPRARVRGRSQSLRCAPQVIGVLNDSASWANGVLQIEINSSSQDPLIDLGTRAIHSGANNYGGHVALAMDMLKIAVANVGDLLDRQVALVVEEALDHRSSVTDIDTGVGFHLRRMHEETRVDSSAFASEALKLATPASVFSRGAESHRLRKDSMGTVAARDARTVIELVRDIAAITLIASCRAVEAMGGRDRLGWGTRAVYDLLAGNIDLEAISRRQDSDVAVVAALIADGQLTGRVS